MKITDTMDYAVLLWYQQQPCWKDAVNRCSYTGLRQGFETEGMCGYISIDVEFDIHDINVFVNLIKSRFDDKARIEIMNIRAKALGKFCNS